MKSLSIAGFLSYAIYTLTTGIGVLMFVSPFFLPSLRQSSNPNLAHTQDSPYLLTFLVGVIFLVLLLEVQGQAMGARTVALLGVLVSINSVLRYAEVIIPLPGGFSPIFFLIVLTGYVFGGRFGFLMGALSLLVSAIITGSIGPWLPSQMMVAGWVGLSAPLCKPLVRWAARGNRVGEVLVLAVFGVFWGFLFGWIINLWFWPFVSGPANQYWHPGVGLGETVKRYLVFYLATSFLWDAARAVGNFLLVAAFGIPSLQALRRFERRFHFELEG